jgi:hypothetical protein
MTSAVVRRARDRAFGWSLGEKARGFPELKRTHRAAGERRIASMKTWDVLSHESLLRGEPPRKFTEICLDDHQDFVHRLLETKRLIRINKTHIV